MWVDERVNNANQGVSEVTSVFQGQYEKSYFIIDFKIVQHSLVV